MLPFEADLSGRQKAQIAKKIHTTGTVSEEEVFSFLDHDEEELKKYLYYISVSYLQKLDQPGK